MKKLLLLSLFLTTMCFTSNSQTSVSILQWFNDSASNGNVCSFASNPPFTSYNQVLVNSTGYDLFADTFLIQCLFGDGFMQTIAACNANGNLFQLPNSNDLLMAGYFYHTYLSAGVYDVTYIVTAPDGKTDTLVCLAENIFGGSCATFSAFGFLDNNGNCIYDSGEQLVYNVPLVLKNGNSFYSQFYTGANNADINSGINYTAEMDIAYLQNLGYAIICGSGLINFTANAGSNTIYFGVGCPAISDVGVYSSGYGFKLGNSATVLSGINVKTCSPVSGSYSLVLDPKLSFIAATVPPASGSGLNYTWNYNNMQSFNNSVSYNDLYFNLTPSAQIGDTLCYTFSLPSGFTDDDLTNNSVTVCYPVKAAWDPNLIEVSPKGTGTSGFIAPGTDLTYTIFFQNTGNDTAKNVYMLDTIDSDLNINSIEVIQTSHPMNLFIFSGNVLKFDFRNINLPDSNVNELASHGYVVYRIKPKNNLADGTIINNNAGIYFDSNPAVVTNTTLNTISLPLGFEDHNFNDIKIYPNPSLGKLFVETVYSNNDSILLTDMAGKTVSRTITQHKTTEIIVSHLEKGIYLLKIQGKSSQVIKKVMIY